MNYPSFYDAVPTINVQDPLSALLGAFDEGKIEYSYIDAVKLAGHSCPTVAGAYLVCLKGLQALYTDSLPQRGAIKVEIADDREEGVTGVIANVITLITGATTTDGFKGMAGKFDRRELLHFNAAVKGVKFTRLDTNESVEVQYSHQNVPGNPKQQELMQLALMGKATDDKKKEFGVLWQERVEKILLEYSDTCISLNN